MKNIFKKNRKPNDSVLTNLDGVVPGNEPKDDNIQDKKIDVAANGGMQEKPINNKFSSLKLFIIRHKLIVLLPICLLLVCASGLLAYSFTHKSEPKVVAPNTAAQAYAADQARTTEHVKESLKTPLSPIATESEKTTYYTNSIIVKTKEGDDAKVAEYYINEVLPKNITLDIDTQEILISLLVKTSHKKEAKALVQKVQLTYKTALSKAVEADKPYIQQKLNKYTALEKTL